MAVALLQKAADCALQQVESGALVSDSSPLTSKLHEGSFKTAVQAELALVFLELVGSGYITLIIRPFLSCMDGVFQSLKRRVYIILR